jgi:hypothetical protein
LRKANVYTAYTICPAMKDVREVEQEEEDDEMKSMQ